MAADWESARFSKPNKQLSAYDFFKTKEHDLMMYDNELCHAIRLFCLKITSKNI